MPAGAVALEPAVHRGGRSDTIQPRPFDPDGPAAVVAISASAQTRTATQGQAVFGAPQGRRGPESPPNDSARSHPVTAPVGRPSTPSASPDRAPVAAAGGTPASTTAATAEGAPSSANGRTPESEADATADPTQPTDSAGNPLSEVEVQQVRELEARDREVRAHEQAHKSAAGPYAGAIHYDYQRGPDSKRYAVGGHVPIDMSDVPGDPAATAEKMAVIRRAALAPAEPSSTDRAVAAEASQREAEARQEARVERTEEAQAATAATESATESNRSTTFAPVIAASGEGRAADEGPASAGRIRSQQLRATIRRAYSVGA